VIPVDGIAHDLRHGARGLLRARAFTTAAVLTLALGIAGATVMFALVQGVLLRPLPVRDQDRLILGWRALPSDPSSHLPIPRIQIDALSRDSRLLEGVAGVDYNGAGSATVVDNGESGFIGPANVTGDFFSVLGVEPILGRALERSDDVPGAELVLVITHGLWQRRYGGAPDVLDRRMLLGGHPYRIVGVMPPDVEYPRGVEAWNTVAASASANPQFGWAVELELDLVARLRPGATIDQVRQEMEGLMPRLDAEAPPRALRGLRPVVRPFADEVVGGSRLALLALFAAVGLVLAISCVNVANLLLMRGAARRGEIAVRSALGAGPGHLARGLLAESVLLALAGGLVGLGVAWWALPVLLALVPGGLPRVESVRIDAGVVAFAAAVSLLAAGVAGVVPALGSTRVDALSVLRAGRRTGGTTALPRGRRVLVVVQVAFAVVVVAAAGLLIRSLLRLQSVDMGMATGELTLVGLDLSPDGDAAREGLLPFLDELTARLESTEGIQGATPVNAPPYVGTGGWDAPSWTAEGQGAGEAARNPILNLEAVRPGYFETLGVTVVRGRTFTPHDRKGAPNVAIVTGEVARQSWPGQDPIGRRLKFGPPDSDESWRTVVGVVAGMRYRELGTVRPSLYLPAEQFIASAHVLVVRTSTPVTLLSSIVRDRLGELDPTARVGWIAPFDALVAKPLARPRWNAFVIGLFGVASFLLATIGLFAVMGAHARDREEELGVRLALGATPTGLRWLVLREGLVLAAVGATLGLAASLATSRVLHGLLYEMDPLDPVSLLGAAVILLGAAALASYLPARALTNADPMAALRTL